MYLYLSLSSFAQKYRRNIELQVLISSSPRAVLYFILIGTYVVFEYLAGCAFISLFSKQILFTTHTYYSPLIKDSLIFCLWLCVCSVIVPHNIYINSQRIKPKNAPVLESKIVKIFHLKTNEKRAPCVRSTYPNPTVPGLSFFMLVSTLFDILFGFSWVLWEAEVKESSIC